MRDVFCFRAQSTVEYLVIISVIIVIALIVVGLFNNISSSSIVSVGKSSEKVGDMSTGGISIVESVADSNGDSLILVSNNSSDGIVLKKISVGGVENSYDAVISGLDSKSISLDGLESVCPCESGKRSTKCEFKFEYLTGNKVTKVEYRTVSVECVNRVVASDEDKVVNPIVEEVVLEDGTSEHPWIINNCLELQDMNQHLDGNYILGNNIDCSATSGWNGGLGFQPIGSDPPFTGSFNGNNHKITGLYIDRVYYVGLFGVVNGGVILNVGLEDSTIAGDSYVGGIVGVANNYALILNSYNTGSVTAAGEDGVGAGGIAGGMNINASIINCYNTGDIIGYTDVGGITGGMDRYSMVKNSYNTGSVTSSGGNSIGGVAGSLEYYCSIINSYNSGSVSRPNDRSVGGVIGYADSDEHDVVLNSFSVGELSGGTNSGGIGSYCSGGVITNSFWYGETIACCGSAGGTCTKEDTLSNLYSSEHDVYLSSPVWDNNWVWSGNSLPTLFWQ